jgi:hypothetical protein
MKPLFNYYTAGETIKDLQDKIKVLQKSNIYPIGDYIKEFTNDKRIISKNFRHYKELSLINELKYIAIKPSSFNFDYNDIQTITSIILKNNKKVLIDAEDAKNHIIINTIIKKLIIDFKDKNNYHIYKTYQMYRRDSLVNMKEDSLYNKIGIKLVRGAYINTDGHLPELFNNKRDTDVAFRDGMNFIFNSNIPSFICTHNLEDIKYMIETVNKNQTLLKTIKHASLYGFIDNETKKIINSGIKTYKYLPYGNIDDAVPYLLRRIQENPMVLKHLFY